MAWRCRPAVAAGSGTRRATDAGRLRSLPLTAQGSIPKDEGGDVASDRIHRPHRHWRSGSRRSQAVLRRAHGRPRPPRVVRHWPRRTAQLRARRRCGRTTVLLPSRGTDDLLTPRDGPSSPRIPGLEPRGRSRSAPVGSYTRRHHPRRAQRVPQYGPHCFATYWLDPHGIKLEAVCHTPEEAEAPSSGGRAAAGFGLGRPPLRRARRVKASPGASRRQSASRHALRLEGVHGCALLTRVGLR